MLNKIIYAITALFSLAVLGGVFWIFYSPSYEIRFDEQLKGDHSVEVEILQVVRARRDGRPDRDFDVRLKLTEVFDIRSNLSNLVNGPDLVNGNVVYGIQQRDRDYLALITTSDARLLVADENLSEYPDVEVLPARQGLGYFSLQPSLNWPDGIAVTAERSPYGEVVDFRVLGEPQAIRDFIASSIEADVLQNWMALSAPAESAHINDRWPAHEMRFSFMHYGAIHFSPYFELASVEEGIASIDMWAEEIYYLPPSDPLAAVEMLTGSVMGEIVYDLACQCLQELTYRALLSTEDKNPPEGLDRISVSIAFEAKYTPLR